MSSLSAFKMHAALLPRYHPGIFIIFFKLLWFISIFRSASRTSSVKSWSFACHKCHHEASPAAQAVIAVKWNGGRFKRAINVTPKQFAVKIYSASIESGGLQDEAKQIRPITSMSLLNAVRRLKFRTRAIARKREKSWESVSSLMRLLSKFELLHAVTV